eukprot:CAMPEP_0197733974 /NCGR_PEP_ID=MMETSP1434-20131217/44184_1 /TAXON_ID=265543 /ORGANISM="Minutocellus polymorphus, Strain CCMP3303" /LENGTH=414 /DNA_ID=CAMNT_0043321375 /DNA_START=74 /DNA_END=1318 /DNA_ORIENTATION=-
MVTIATSTSKTPSTCSSTGLRRLLEKNRRSNPSHRSVSDDRALAKSNSTCSFSTASTTSSSTSSLLSMSSASMISNPRMEKRVVGASSCSEEIADTSYQRCYFYNGGEDADVHANDSMRGIVEEVEATTSPTCSSTCPINDGKDTAKTTVTRRRVRFNETVAIGSIPQLVEYSPAELESMYYSHLEENNLRAEAKYIVKSIRMARMQEATGRSTAASARILEDDGSDGDGEYCPRGLENYLRTREEKRERKAEAKDLAYSVLLAQEEQWDALFAAAADEDEDNALTSYTEKDLEAAQNAIAMESVTRSRRSRAAAIEMALQDEEDVRQMILEEDRERRARLDAQQQQEEEQESTEQAHPKPARGKATRRMSSAASTIASKVVRRASLSVNRRRTASVVVITTAAAGGSARATCA